MKQRISEWWQLTTQTRPTLAYVGLSVLVALIITGIILGLIIPGVKADAADQVRAVSDRVTANLTATTYQLQADLDSLQAAVDGQISTVSDALYWQMAVIQGQLTSMANEMAGMVTAMTMLNQTMLEPYLGGTFGNYTIHAQSRVGGNFTAIVHLLYSAGLGITALEDMLAGINWTGESVPAYMPGVTFNGTDWVVGELWWNVGILQLQPGGPDVFPVPCPGLNATWTPTIAYVELFRV